MVRRTRVTVAIGSVIFWILFMQAASSQISAKEVFSAQIGRFERVHSFSAFSKKIMIYGAEAPSVDWALSNGGLYIKDKKGSIFQTTHFYLKGDFYISSWESKNSGEDTRRRDTAYDGTFQDYYRDTRVLHVREKPRGSKRQPYYVAPAALDP